MDHRKKVAVITGASRGIGKAIALKYAQEGYDVAICCHSQKERLDAVSDEIRGLGRSCFSFIGDLGREDTVTAFFDGIRERFGHVDVLVNNAGISYFGLLQDMTSQEWERVISVNLSSVFYCSRQAVQMMLPQKSGKILSISSVWGCVGASMEVAYSAAKGGVNAFTKALAKELAPSNIQVNAIACGMIDTEMNAHLSEEELGMVIEEIPAGRMGSASEVAGLAFDINRENTYLTGQVITLDGGWC